MGVFNFRGTALPHGKIKIYVCRKCGASTMDRRCEVCRDISDSVVYTINPESGKNTINPESGKFDLQEMLEHIDD